MSIEAHADPTSLPGRVCPTDYRYDPKVFARPAEFEADVLYVVGGLYGNAQALDTIETLAAKEPTPPIIVFNGDFHWFDAEPAWFAEIQSRVSAHRALRGNVESEIARPGDIGAGCGCAYPPSVDEGVVRRSNAILAALRAVAQADANAPRTLAALPMHYVAQVGPLRVGIVHGDAEALAGWRFDPPALDDPRRKTWLAHVRAASGIDVFASTHTCLPGLRRIATPEGTMTVINNGAAGMPNFSGTRFGLISRIARRPGPHRSLYAITERNVHIESIAVEYDAAAFERQFLARWPQSSPAYESYYSRIRSGPAYALEQASPSSESVPAQA
jgi:hypothetical protein